MLSIEDLVARLIKDEQNLQLDRSDALASTYLKSYPEFVRYFQQIDLIEAHHLIIAANFTYQPVVLVAAGRLIHWNP